MARDTEEPNRVNLALRPTQAGLRATGWLGVAATYASKMRDGQRSWKRARTPN